MSRNKQGRLEHRSKPEQIADYYAKLIEIGEIKDGEQLPGRSQIAATWGVGVMVAQTALTILRERKLAVTIQRRGTYAVGPDATSAGTC